MPRGDKSSYTDKQKRKAERPASARSRATKKAAATRKRLASH
jgi:hypothetical protein